jgi:GDP-mannose 6-dehydrogenase
LARVAVFGLGYVGSVSAACLAQLNHQVIGIDRDEFKVRSILDGRAPFFEPGLEEIVRQTVGSARLTASTSAREGVLNSDIALICVGTPSERNGNLGLDQLRRAVAEIAECLRERSEPYIVAVRSTVFPGTCEEVVLPLLSQCHHVQVVSNPEFLREGVAVKDFIEPSLVVVGGSDDAAVSTVANLYADLGVTPCMVSLRTAEMIKYACNAFHAVKIAFANETGSLCAKLGVSAQEVMDTLCRDTRLNISPAYLKPGFAFGGSCLPKDLRALTYRASRLDLDLPLLESTLPSNEAHLRRAIEQVMDLPAKRIGVVGLAFKENTDDLRESPVVTMLEHLIGKGRDVRVFDPCIQLEAIYGSNRNFILNAIPHIGRLLDSSLESLCEWADYLVVTQKPSPELTEQLRRSGLPLINVAAAPRKPAEREPLAQGV